MARKTCAFAHTSLPAPSRGLRDAGPGSLVAGSAGRPRASTRGPILAQTTRNADWTYYRPMSNLLAKIRQWFGFDKKPDEPKH